MPLAKIYAMMAMSKDNDSAFQAFKLPLSPIERPSDMHDEYAKLSVGISYQQKVHNKSSIDLIESKSPCVCIAVSVLRACGLKVQFFKHCCADLLFIPWKTLHNTLYLIRNLTEGLLIEVP